MQKKWNKTLCPDPFDCETPITPLVFVFCGTVKFYSGIGITPWGVGMCNVCTSAGCARKPPTFEC